MKNRIHLHQKLRHSVTGTAQRPRLAVYRSLNNLFAQLINDETGQTLASASSLKAKGSLTVKAQTVGADIAGKAQELKITTVVFDRGGFGYRGVIAALAQTAREKGLKF